MSTIRNLGPEIDAMRLGVNWNTEDLDRPQILIDSTQGDSHPGSNTLYTRTDEIKNGIVYQQGKPLEFFVTDICDGIAQGHEGMNYSLVSREVIAAMVEIHARVNPIDGMVLVSSCDKAIPGHLMVAARLNIPTLHVPGGVMLTGPYGLTGEQIGTFDTLYKKNQITMETFQEKKKHSCPTSGACQYLGTAGTMQSMSEALGMALPHSALVPSYMKVSRDLARNAGYQIVSLAKQKIKARDILTYEAFYNAIAVHAAIGGSTNALLHLPAIAHEAGIEIKPSLFDEINRKIPYLANVRPSGKYSTEYLWFAGGIPAVMKEIKDFLYLDVMTCTGKTLRQNLEEVDTDEYLGYLANYKMTKNDLIRTAGQAEKTGSIAILSGNIAKDGAVVKYAAVSEKMFKHTGPARVFDREVDARDAINTGAIKPGDVVIVRFAGPKGSGMPEMFYTTEAIAAQEELISTTALVTDGRFSGASRGPVIGHVSPEAAQGGEIGLVQEGDLVEIDITARSLNVVGIQGEKKAPGEVKEEFLRRKAAAKPQKETQDMGILRIYKKLATSAMDGGYMG